MYILNQLPSLFSPPPPPLSLPHSHPLSTHISSMKMEFMAEFTEGMSRVRARKIIKRKRTKRQRPCSPLTTSGNTNTSGDTTTEGNCFCLIDNNQSPVISPEISSEVSSKEDEDMANCLILLAQSVSPVTDEKYSRSNSDHIGRKTEKTEKLSCRRFSGSGEKSGFYAYECKTCNRTFPSFQALGGHRASHKKPKVNVEEKKVNYYYSVNDNNIIIPPDMMNNVEEEEEVDHDQQTQQTQQKTVTEDEENKTSVITIINHNMKTKVHECSICGSEFISGQALGGHMRKHRPVPVSGNRMVISGTTTTDDNNTGEQIIEKSGSNCMVLLDLNFPPPEESKFQFTATSSQQQQQHLVFSSPAFVNCTY